MSNMADGDFRKKKGPFKQSGGYVSPARPVHVNPPASRGMRMELGLSLGVRTELRICLSPPIASSVEEARQIAAADRPEIISYPDTFVEIVRNYVAGESSISPYSDEQIASYVAGKGYDSMTRQDVARVRGILGIEPSTLRKK